LKPPPENLLRKYSQDDAFVFLLRHGQTCGSETKSFIGITDVDLDPTGILQASYWKQAFGPINLDAVYSSSLNRCDDTAQLIANGKKVIKTSALNEINMGSWDGQTFDRIKKDQPNEFKKRGHSIDIFKAPGGESFYDVSLRAIPFFNLCANDIEKDMDMEKGMRKGMGGKILIVTHAGVIRVILCHILKLKLKELFQIKLSFGQLFVFKKFFKGENY
jgi:alpha-ribazole phosphatase